MTKADKIRAMTDEQIVRTMQRWMDCVNCPCYDAGNDDCKGNDSCYDQLLTWLKQEE